MVVFSGMVKRVFFCYQILPVSWLEAVLRIIITLRAGNSSTYMCL